MLTGRNYVSSFHSLPFDFKLGIFKSQMRYFGLTIGLQVMNIFTYVENV